MQPLTPAELQSMRAVQADTFTDSAAIRRVTTSSDGAGGTTTSEATIATVPCRVAPAGNMPQERQIADQLRGEVLWRITLPTGTDVTNRDRLVINGRTFEVVAVLAPATLETARGVVATEVR